MAGSLLRLYVERFTPALRLYERLGFRQIDDRGVFLFMEWRGDNSQRPNDPTIQGTPFQRRGESRTDKLVGRLSPHCSNDSPWKLDRWIVGS